MLTKLMRNEQYSINFNNHCASKSKWSRIDRQVKQLQIQHQQMSAKIVEKMNCGRMQLDIISTFMNRNQASNSDHQDAQHQQHQQNSSKLLISSGSTFGSQLSQSTGVSNKSMKEQLKNQQDWLTYLQNTLKEDNQMVSHHLINKQIEIQSRKQLNLKLKNYQTRIRQMQQILVRKQIDISILSNENYKLPKLPVVRKFTNQCIELSNIKTMGDKYKQISKQCMRLKNKKETNQQILTQITSSVENNACLPNKNRNVPQNILEERAKQRLSKKIMKQEEIGLFNDPLFKKIIKILQKQLQRQQKLLKQYNELKNNRKVLEGQVRIYKQNKISDMNNRADNEHK